MRKSSGGSLPPLWSILFWILLWQIISILWNQPIVMVSPWQVVTRLAQLLPTWTFWYALFSSSLRILLGFLLGLAGGTALALLSLRSPVLESLFAPILWAMGSIPVASFVILALILFSSQSLAILISFLIATPIFYRSIYTGVQTCPKSLLEMAQVFDLPLFRQIRYLYLPHMAPLLQSTASTTMGLCWKAGVAAEVIGMPTHSIGGHLQQAKLYLDTSGLFAWTLVLILLSFLWERLLLWSLKALFQRMERI